MLKIKHDAKYHELLSTKTTEEIQLTKKYQKKKSATTNHSLKEDSTK